MADITQGMQISTTIELWDGSGDAHTAKAIVTYTWEPVKGRVEEDPEGNLEETWIDNRLVIDIEGIYDRVDTENPNRITTDYLLNTFLPASSKYYGEEDWVNYQQVVIDSKKVKFERTKNSAKLGTVNFTLKKKSPGLTT